MVKSGEFLEIILIQVKEVLWLSKGGDSSDAKLTILADWQKGNPLFFIYAKIFRG
jgi:hypothetical protein